MKLQVPVGGQYGPWIGDTLASLGWSLTCGYESLWFTHIFRFHRGIMCMLYVYVRSSVTTLCIRDATEFRTAEIGGNDTRRVSLWSQVRRRFLLFRR